MVGLLTRLVGGDGGGGGGPAELAAARAAGDSAQAEQRGAVHAGLGDQLAAAFEAGKTLLAQVARACVLACLTCLRVCMAAASAAALTPSLDG